MHRGGVLSAFHLGSSRWKPNLVTRLRHHSCNAAFHSGSSRWKRIWLLGTLLNQTKLPPSQARWRAEIWNTRRDLVAKLGFHPRKVDGVPGNTKQSYAKLRNDEQKWHNSKRDVYPRQQQIFNSPGQARIPAHFSWLLRFQDLIRAIDESCAERRSFHSRCLCRTIPMPRTASSNMMPEEGSGTAVIVFASNDDALSERLAKPGCGSRNSVSPSLISDTVN